MCTVRGRNGRSSALVPGGCGSAPFQRRAGALVRSRVAVQVRARIRPFWRVDDCAKYTRYVVELGDVIDEVGAFDRGLRHRGVCRACLTGSITVPPSRWMAVAPVAPSCPLPESTTAVARGPHAVASVASRRSAEGRLGGLAPETINTVRAPLVTSVCFPGGATTTVPAMRSASSRAATTGSRDRRCRICTSAFSRSGAWWMSTTTAAWRSSGSPSSTIETASRPPAEAISATTCCCPLTTVRSSLTGAHATRAAPPAGRFLGRVRCR